MKAIVLAKDSLPFAVEELALNGPRFLAHGTRLPECIWHVHRQTNLFL